MEDKLKRVYDSLSTKTYRVVLTHNETDAKLIQELEKRGYNCENVNLGQDWFMEIHNNDKKVYTDRYSTFMFLFGYRCGVRLRDLRTSDILNNIDKLIDHPDKDFYFALIAGGLEMNGMRGKRQGRAKDGNAVR